MRTEEGKAKQREAIKRWRKANPEKVKAYKKRFYESEKGKVLKKKEEESFKASGGRAKAEAKRSNLPISEPRKRAKIAYKIKVRGLSKGLPEFDSFVLSEAIALCRLREQLLGIKWDVDHIIPVSKGGTSVYTNLQVVPSLWNKRKSNLHTERFFGNK